MADENRNLNTGQVANGLTTGIGVTRGVLGHSIENNYFGANDLYRTNQITPNVRAGNFGTVESVVGAGTKSAELAAYAKGLR